MSMEKLPTEITLCRLECVLIPNGEIIVLGITVGWFKALSSHLSVVDADKQKLEAAAPELLATCKSLMGYIDAMVGCPNPHEDEDGPIQCQICEMYKDAHAAIAKATT